MSAVARLGQCTLIVCSFNDDHDILITRSPVGILCRHGKGHGDLKAFRQRIGHTVIQNKLIGSRTFIDIQVAVTGFIHMVIARGACDFLILPKCKLFKLRQIIVIFNAVFIRRYRSNSGIQAFFIFQVSVNDDLLSILIYGCL